MTKVFLKREDAPSREARDGETLEAFFNRTKADGDADTWEELAIYNWGTKEPKEVNRAMLENIGLSFIKDGAPNLSTFDRSRGLRKEILLPKAWTKDSLALEKTHTIKIRKRLPAPAVSITKLSQWFVPRDETCTIEYSLEGVLARAHKVDYEIHGAKYYERNKGGELVSPSDKEKPYIVLQKNTFIGDPTQYVPPPPDLTIINWKGESEATSGVLKPGGSATAYINAVCAPYPVVIRYYKDDKDAKATIILEPFFLCWKRTSSGPVLDKSKLVVRWKIKDDNSKLKVGQLHVWDKDDKLVFRAVLSKEKLKEGKYDLLTEPVKWKESEILEDQMPYRVQIQAHSDMDEDNGLALAVMHTEVRTFKYEWVQCIAFDIKPGTKSVKGVRTYLGDKNDDTDINNRCEILKDAIKVAYAEPSVNRHPSVLKIMMAPEFYFRGARGAYELEKISGIIDKLRVETDKFEYADWLFQFGTALGLLKHEQDTGSGVEEKRYDVQIVGLDDSDPSFTKIKVKSKICSRIPSTTDKGKGAVRWKVKQAPSAEIEVVECTLDTGDVYWLKFEAKGKYSVGAAELVEPLATEVFNVALVQKGWPMTSPCDESGLRRVIVYKEKVSSIDFLLAAANDDLWFDEGGVGRKIKIHGNKDRTVLPTEGADDLLGASPNLPSKTTKWMDKSGGEHTTGSEINKSGEGGGSVFTIDDITFGLEVCLDHGYSRLGDFYDKGVAKGDPKVQILLIPSWGMSIGRGKVACVPNGVVFNVDGGRSDSVVRVFDGAWSCDVHEDVVAAGPGKCPKSTKLCVDRPEYFANCHGYLSKQPFKCPTCKTPAAPYDLRETGAQVGFLEQVAVPSANNPHYFQTSGVVNVYEVQKIPDPEVA
jgi:hypothetical protein